MLNLDIGGLARDDKSQLANLVVKDGKKGVGTGRIHTYANRAGKLVTVAVMHHDAPLPGVPMLETDPYRLVLDGESVATASSWRSNGGLVPLAEVNGPVTTRQATATPTDDNGLTDAQMRAIVEAVKAVVKS